MITSYPAYINRLDIESLNKYVPSGESFFSVALKEILDNALDSAEKSDNTVGIEYHTENDINTSYISIINNGEIPKQVIKNIGRFDINTSEKFKQYSYGRGQIGQGLKLAIAMATVNTNYFYIETGKNNYEISIKDRNPEKHSNVVSIKTLYRKKNYDNTCITFACPSIESSEEIIAKYKIANPHINFICGKGDEYNFKKTINLNKNLKNDISKYRYEDIAKLTDFYKLKDIVNSFEIPEYRKNKIINLSDILNNAKTIKPLFFGQKALQDRLDQIYIGKVNILSYKKIGIDNGFLELAVLDKELKIIAVNGSVIDNSRISIFEENNSKLKSGLIMSLNSFLSDIKFRKGLIFLYSNSRPEYKDANKQAILITPSNQEFKKIKNFLKNFSKNSQDKDNWHLCNSKNELIEKIVETANEIYNEMGMQITVRQLYYQLVSRGYIKNGKYNTLNPLLTNLREEGILDWRIFEDRSRVIFEPTTIEPDTNVKHLILNYVKTLSVPPVNKWHNQTNYLELWYEKDALSSYFQNIADKWKIITFATRGFNSTTNNKETIERFNNHKNKKCVILYCGDCDPYGIQIYQTLLKKIKNIEIKRIALTNEQIKKFNLIEMPDMKGNTLTRERFIEKYGDKAYELDALSGKELMNILDDSISKYFIPNLYDNSYKDKENQALLENIKNNIINLLT